MDLTDGFVFGFTLPSAIKLPWSSSSNCLKLFTRVCKRMEFYPCFWHFKRDPLSVAWTKHLVVQIRVVGGAPKWVLKKCFTITLSPRIKALVMSTNEYLCSWWTMHCNQIQPNIIAFLVSQWYLSIVLSLSVNESIVKMQWFRQFRFLRTIKG